MCCVYLWWWWWCSLTLALFSLLCCNFSCCCCRFWSARHLDPANGDFGVCFLSFCGFAFVQGLLDDDPDILGLFLTLLFTLTDLLAALLLLLFVLGWEVLLLLWPLWLNFLPLPSCVLITPRRANSSSTTSLTSSCSSSIVSTAYTTRENSKRGR